MRTKWGNWTYDRNRLCLVLSVKTNGYSYGYEVDLERCNTSAQMLDWIFQVKQKGFATTQVMYDLLSALRDTLDPQANLCSCGMNKEIDTTEILTIAK